MNSKAVSMRAYRAALPADRRKTIARARPRFPQCSPTGSREAVPFGNIVWEDLRERYPQTYNGEGWMRAGLAAQHRYFALDLPCAFQEVAAATLASRRSKQR